MEHGSIMQGTLRKNVTLVQKSSKTSVEQSFFAGCPQETETGSSRSVKMTL
jgi:hypothetical protein